MDPKQPNIFESIEGLEKVDPKALEDFQREMTERVIPEIVKAVEERKLLAAESRTLELKRETLKSK